MSEYGKVVGVVEEPNRWDMVEWGVVLPVVLSGIVAFTIVITIKNWLTTKPGSQVSTRAVYQAPKKSK